MDPDFIAALKKLRDANYKLIKDGMSWTIQIVSVGANSILVKGVIPGSVTRILLEGATYRYEGSNLVVCCPNDAVLLFQPVAPSTRRSLVGTP